MAEKGNAAAAKVKRKGKLEMERRKLPRQRRAKMTVESILQAARELIREEDFTHVGTARIAERAGVNIASVYQYFPNRESILYSLYEAAAEEGARKLNATVMNVHQEQLEDSVPKIMKLLLAHYEQNHDILLRMNNHLPEIQQAMRVVTFEHMIRSAIRLFLQQHPEYSVKQTPRHLFFLENIIVGNIHRYVQDPPADVSRTEFITHLSRIIAAYLRGELSSVPISRPGRKSRT